VLVQMVNVFVCRHPPLPAWRFPFFENRLLLGVAEETRKWLRRRIVARLSAPH